MIAYINGEIKEITDQAIQIETSGIGYEVICPNPFRFQEYMGKKQKVYIYHHVREDAQILYGFQTQDEKILFTNILNVSGIGPKGALNVLSSSSVENFVIAIEQEDEKFLTSFPGVGKKTARQMILDLKGKLPFHVAVKTDDTGQVTADAANPALEEGIQALKALGYMDREINQIKPVLQKENHRKADEYIRKGLSLLTK